MKEFFNYLVQKPYFTHIAVRWELFGSRVQLIGSWLELIGLNPLLCWHPSIQIQHPIYFKVTLTTEILDTILFCVNLNQ